MRIKSCIAGIALLALAGCGNSIGEQAAGGAAIGGAAAVVTNGSLARGAALGAGANVLFCQLAPNRCY